LKEERRVLLLRQGTGMEQGDAEFRVGAFEEGGRETGSAYPYPNLKEKFFYYLKGLSYEFGF
jgi:hypothetical protein